MEYVSVYTRVYIYTLCVCVCVCVYTHTHTYVDVNNIELLSVAMATQQNALFAFLSGRKTFHTSLNALILFMSSCRFPDVLIWW